MLEGSFQQFPDLYFVFVTNDADTFTELVHDAQTILRYQATARALQSH